MFKLAKSSFMICFPLNLQTVSPLSSPEVQVLGWFSHFYPRNLQWICNAALANYVSKCLSKFRFPGKVEGRTSKVQVVAWFSRPYPCNLQWI